MKNGKKLYNERGITFFHETERYVNNLNNRSKNGTNLWDDLIPTKIISDISINLKLEISLLLVDLHIRKVFLSWLYSTNVFESIVFVKLPQCVTSHMVRFLACRLWTIQRLDRTARLPILLFRQRGQIARYRGSIDERMEKGTRLGRLVEIKSIEWHHRDI